MKKSIYPPCLILLVLLLVPVTACTTKTAAEKPQDTPSRQEQPAGNTSADDAPTQASTAEDTASGLDTVSTKEAAPKPDVCPLQDASRETLPNNSQEAAAKPDAVSGATIDSVSGATVSQRQKTEAADNAEPPAADNIAAQQPDVPSPALAAKLENPAVAVQTAPEAGNEVPLSDTASDDIGEAAAIASPDTSVPADTITEQSVIVASSADTTGSASIVANTEAAIADAASDTAFDPTQSTAIVDTTAEQAPIIADTETVSSNPESSTAAAEEPVQPIATTDNLEPAAEQNVPAYETTLADLISDFEKQGGSHGYEPPPTFQEEMRDLFSPQIFTVALSKEPETEQKPKVSRMVAVEEKQRLELTYPGHGWVYVGEQTSQPGLKYEQRKLQDENSIFMFTAEKKGDYILHFSYFDVFTNEFVTDAVAVSVSAARSTAAKAMVKAPDYQTEADSDATEAQANKNTQAAASQPSSNSTANTGTSTTTHTAQAASEAPQTAGAGSQSKTSEQAMSAGMAEAASSTAENTDDSTGQVPTAASKEVLSSDQLLEKARTAIAAADAGTALTYLNNFFTTAEEKLDEGWFLKGRAYELNGSARNIRLALDAYKTITDTFPQSKYWAEADARIRYITGFYINIQ